MCGIAWILFFFPTGARLRRWRLPPSPVLFLITRPPRATPPRPSKRTTVAATSFLSAVRRLNCRRFSMGILCPVDDGRGRGGEETHSRKTCLYSRSCKRASERTSAHACDVPRKIVQLYLVRSNRRERVDSVLFFPFPSLPFALLHPCPPRRRRYCSLSRFSHPSFHFSLFLSPLAVATRLLLIFCCFAEFILVAGTLKTRSFKPANFPPAKFRSRAGLNNRVNSERTADAGALFFVHTERAQKFPGENRARSRAGIADTLEFMLETKGRLCVCALAELLEI